jgi:hypothetical protein
MKQNYQPTNETIVDKMGAERRMLHTSRLMARLRLREILTLALFLSLGEIF